MVANTVDSRSTGKCGAICIEQSLTSTLFPIIRPGERIRTGKTLHHFTHNRFYLKLRGSKLNIKRRGHCYKLQQMREVKTFEEEDTTIFLKLKYILKLIYYRK